MQPQSDKQSASRLATTTTSHTTAAAATAATSSSAAAHAGTPPKVKVIKSKRPLCHFKFYLDICDHQLTKRIETDIKALGGHLEFFLSDNITHFITDKPEVISGGAPQPGKTPGTPGTPSTPTNHYQQEDGSARKPNQRQSRADAILSRVRRSTVGVANNSSNSTPTTSVKRSYTIWQTDYAQRFIKRIQTELKQYLEGKKEGSGGGGAATASPHHIQLKKQYVKIESVKRNYRPYYHLIKQPDDWPKIDLSSEDGAFRLLTKSKTKEKDQSMTRKSLGSRTSQKEKPAAAPEEKQPPKHPAVQQLKRQSTIPNSPRSNYREPKDSSEKQGGVCEICKLEYDILNIHLQSKDHELFAKNSENFLALDTLILSSANVNQFLAEEPQESELDMDVDETMSNEEQQQSPRQRPSPALREKSKRITKGKHSSEKFQAASPQTPSPGGKKTLGPLPGSLSELQRQEHPTTAAATPTTTNSGRRKTTQNSGLSPPIRAMLPPSSLYKVVETREECATPPRRGRPPNQTDSPSLIVKFQKIRQTELQRLNGEAENFMFPRTAVTTTTTTRSSSELPTDVDRQTTSDVRGRYSISSASLDTSTSEAETKESSGLLPASSLRKRAQAVGRRRKTAGPAAGEELLQRQLSTGSSSSNSNNNQQRFPSAPIQPEEQEPEPQQQPQSQPKLKIKLKQTQVVVAATRKSSRTATAIVTAATASSRQQQQLRQTTGGGRRMTTNLEDRMGESVKPKIKIKKEIIAQEEDEEELQELQELLEETVDSEEEMELELDSSLSSGSDEDYIASNRSRTTKGAAASSSSTRKSTDTREQRAARRLSRLTINRSAGETELIETKLSKSSPTRRSRGKSQKPTSPAKSSKGKQPKTVPQSSDLVFDCSKSERLQQMQYTFESLPSAELWNRVFLRQDAGEEHYYTYYGSTRYRKLPYEMGPIPMARTLPAHSCALCRGEQKEEEQKEQRPEELTINPVAKKEIKREEEAAQSSSSSSMYKHKKLHLLQRYQQEQEQLQQQLEGNALATATAIAAKCDSKASTPELLEREFASGPLGDRVQLIERVRSTSSSSCSNSQRSGITCRNKQISRITELPPRKSPREHASTLALVSCIIRQRQDSQSKTNSEAEEPPPPVVAVAAPKLKTPLKQEVVAAPSSPRTTRSQAATPVEELRFATEISETVKRMRRGQNKYDHSPPAPAPAPNPTPTATSSPARSRRLTPAAAQNLAPSYSRRLEFSTSQRESSSAASLLLGKGKGKRRAANPPASGTVRPPAPQPPGMGGVFRGVRKLPSKKGLLEYDMEPCALKALDKAMQYTNPGFAAWQLDKYLELAGKEYDLDVEQVTEGRRDQRLTPPPTDCCFTSEFDLYDLLLGSAGSGDDEEDLARGSHQTGSSRRMSSQNLYATYYRKRKNLKSNRTGWPKSQRRRNGGGLLGRSLPNERINFLKMGLAEFHPIKQEPMETEEEQTTTTTTTTTTTSASREKLLSKEDEDDEGGGNPGGGGGEDEGESPAGDKQNPRQDVVMTPPATDIDELAEPPDVDDNESLPEEDETMADSVDQQQDDEAEIEATDADVEEEEEEDEEEEDDVFEDAYDEPQVGIKKKEEPSPEKRARIPSISVSTPPEEHSTPGKKLLLTLHNGQRLQATSTPSTGQQVQQQQQQRRTPQLNGSLGSCISPSEKLGDNSDIFTVSSDGLDTDLDLSNTQAGDSHEQHCPHQTTTTTPKRKFDISKYAPPNNGKAASSCAAEAATAAVKSLAISQFLKKEVRVTCRRLRAPFRRFRYRR